MLGIDYDSGSSGLAKKSLYQKVSSFKQWKFLNSGDFVKSDMIKAMKKAQKGLKKIDSIKMRSDIELIKYDNTTTPAFLWQDHYILSFYFFVVMVGFTDACIDYEDKNISYNTKFVGVDSKYHKQEIHMSRKKIKEILSDRNRIVSDCLDCLKNEWVFYDIAKKVLESSPSYLTFSELYNDSKENSFQLYLHQHLINAYNIGYMSGNYNYHERMKKYNELLFDLNNHKLRNKNNLEGVKVKNKTK